MGHLGQREGTSYMPYDRPGLDDVVGDTGDIPADLVAAVSQPHTRLQVGVGSGPVEMDGVGDLG